MNAHHHPRGASLLTPSTRMVVGVSEVIKDHISVTVRPDDGNTSAEFLHLERAEALRLARFIVLACRPTAGELLAI